MTNKIVVISDVHFNLQNLELSTNAVRHALKTAYKLECPLLICGDLNDTKALLRAEVVNRLIDIFEPNKHVDVYVLIGNHDLLNEKGKEHTLNFLAPYVTLISSPQEIGAFYAIPYQTSRDALEQEIAKAPVDRVLFMHQGVSGAFMGDYLQDRTSVDLEVFNNRKVFSGHYHRHQKIGTVTYIGNPFTMSFGEANDPNKGYLVVQADGSYKRIELNFRKHIVSEQTVGNFSKISCKSDDLVWVKVKGTKSELAGMTKETINAFLGLPNLNFKLDHITITQESETQPIETIDKSTIFTTLIDALPDDEAHKNYLKELLNDVTKS